MTPCEYVETAVARIVPSPRSTRTARPDSVPKSTPTAYLLTLRTLPAAAAGMSSDPRGCPDSGCGAHLKRHVGRAGSERDRGGARPGAGTAGHGRTDPCHAAG